MSELNEQLSNRDEQERRLESAMLALSEEMVELKEIQRGYEDEQMPRVQEKLFLMEYMRNAHWMLGKLLNVKSVCGDLPSVVTSVLKKVKGSRRPPARSIMRSAVLSVLFMLFLLKARRPIIGVTKQVMTRLYSRTMIAMGESTVSSSEFEELVVSYPSDVTSFRRLRMCDDIIQQHLNEIIRRNKHLLSSQEAKIEEFHSLFSRINE